MDEIKRKIEIPEAHYTLFNATRDALPEVIVVNDALLRFEHGDIFPWSLRVRLEAEGLGDHGMPTPDESRLLFEIGDAIESKMLDTRTALGARNALFLARSTWNALRELYFQVHDPEIADAALKQMLAEHDGSREWEYRMTHDPQWEEAGWIFRLFPLANGVDG